MARYRRFEPRFWKDEKVRTLTLTEKSIAIYCFTAQSNRIGIFSFSPGEGCEDLELKPETFAKGFRNVCRTLDWRWDERHRVLYIPTWWKYNPPENENNVIGNLKDLAEVPQTPFLSLFSNNLQYLPETLHQTFTQTFAKRYRNVTETFAISGAVSGAVSGAEKELLSGSPNPDTTLPLSRTTARELLTYLNEQAGHNYRPVDANLDLIVARLHTATKEEVRSVIDCKVKAWKSDPKMKIYLRPDTLFRSGKFEQYLGQVGTSPPQVSPSSPSTPSTLSAHGRYIQKLITQQLAEQAAREAEEKASVPASEDGGRP